MQPDPSAKLGRAVFVHHSVGRYMLLHGNVRKHLAQQGVPLWDSDYNKIGARDHLGARAEAPEVPDDNTDPEGFLNIFARHSESDERFASWLASFDVIALKSCYPTSNISSDDELLTRQRLYERLATLVSDRLPRTILLTPPPLAPLRTSPSNAARACRLARWLAQDMTLPSNVSVFDLHDVLAHPDGQGDGTLARPYRRIIPFDSHPNSVGARTAGECFAQHVVQVLLSGKGAD